MTYVLCGQTILTHLFFSYFLLVEPDVHPVFQIAHLKSIQLWANGSAMWKLWVSHKIGYSINVPYFQAAPRLFCFVLKTGLNISQYGKRMSFIPPLSLSLSLSLSLFFSSSFFLFLCLLRGYCSLIITPCVWSSKDEGQWNIIEDIPDTDLQVKVFNTFSLL